MDNSTQHIVWNDKMRIDIPAIDYEHKNIIYLINELIDEINLKQPTSWCSEVAIELIDSVVRHMEFEESLLRIAKYPELDEHRASHLDFIHNIVELGNKIQSLNDKHAMVELRDYIITGWVKHILIEDMEFKEHLLSKNVE